jgi:hypothetical protein
MVSMKKIKLTKNEFALIDDEDFDLVGLVGWHCHVDKYAVRNYRKRDGAQGLLLMHRIIMNCPDSMQVDHIDGNGLNNQKSNLRICTQSQNKKNKRRASNNTSGYKGVYIEKENYIRSYITFNGKRIVLGWFSNVIDAAKAYDEAAKLYFGEFAKLNFPERGTP